MTNITPIIGIGGLKESGKSAAADRLVDEFGYVKIEMSDPLHQALLTLNPIVKFDQLAVMVDPDTYEARVLQANPVRYADLVQRLGYVEAKRNPEVRRLLQSLGTDVGRNMIDENVWVDIVRRQVIDHLDAGTPVALVSVRFPNEMDLVEELGGTTVWIDRPEVTARAAGDTSSAAQHASEHSVDPEDFLITLVNDGTLDDLRAKVDEIAKQVAP